MKKLKAGVSLVGLKAPMVIADSIVTDVYSRYGYDTIITSGTEGLHGPQSLHYVGYALDYRTRHLEKDADSMIADAIRLALTKEFDVILHDTHIHVEFQPKRWK